MCTCEVTKARSFARNFLLCELSFICISDVSYRFNLENDYVLLEFKLYKNLI